VALGYDSGGIAALGYNSEEIAALEYEKKMGSLLEGLP
jgi:hypothetical protein